jgi:two-component sensor histidine kinase
VIHLEVTVADDGIGFPEGFEIKTPTTLGLRLINILVGQLIWTIDLTRPEPGQDFTVTLPIKNLQQDISNQALS